MVALSAINDHNSSIMKNYLRNIARKRFKVELESLPELERDIFDSFSERQPISRDTTKDHDTDLTFG